MKRHRWSWRLVRQGFYRGTCLRGCGGIKEVVDEGPRGGSWSPSLRMTGKRRPATHRPVPVPRSPSAGVTHEP